MRESEKMSSSTNLKIRLENQDQIVRIKEDVDFREKIVDRSLRVEEREDKEKKISGATVKFLN